jgi:hypothetical protein
MKFAAEAVTLLSLKHETKIKFENQNYEHVFRCKWWLVKYFKWLKTWTRIDMYRNYL